jgi:hypothetical protein
MAAVFFTLLGAAIEGSWDTYHSEYYVLEEQSSPGDWGPVFYKDIYQEDTNDQVTQRIEKENSQWITGTCNPDRRWVKWDPQY